MHRPTGRYRALASVLLTLYLALASSLVSSLASADDNDEEVIGEFLLLLYGSPQGKQQALDFVTAQWQPGFLPMAIEVLTFNRDPAFGPQLVSLLEEKTGQTHGYDINRWFQWQWGQQTKPAEAYPEFKSALYGVIDPQFEQYFGKHRSATIRLDEVVWGGVKQDGIPPLRNPKMIDAAQADYLAEGDVVFGLEVNGDARAYPRRILGWHEMFIDEVGGVPVAGVYCTLCGTMILYQTEVNGVNRELGTSGFLYRSNKLMYDRATQSLWNTIWGEPVIGPLAGQGIALERLSVVTTNWGEWRRRHPASKVLSLDTGYARDYSEGAAYRQYFSTDALMFQVPKLDTRLKNKDEVLGLILPQRPDLPLAISADYLSRHPLYQDQLGEQTVVVLTDNSGANRVYQSAAVQFTDWDGDGRLLDSTGETWRLDEAALRSRDGRTLYRLPAQRAFWFGWFSAYGHTRLVH